jgi:hypothetical protein
MGRLTSMDDFDEISHLLPYDSIHVLAGTITNFPDHGWRVSGYHQDTGDMRKGFRTQA